MKKTFLLVVLALITGLASFAQDKAPGTSKSNDFDPYWYVNLNAGRSFLVGDLKTTPLDFAKLGKQTGFIGGFFAGRQFTSIFGLRGIVNGGTYKSRLDRSANLYKEKTHDFGYYLEPTLDITNLIKYNADRKLNLYGFTGVGFNNFYVDLTNNTGSTPVTTTVFKSGKGSSNWTTATTLPYGLGTKYKFNENWGINLEATNYYAFNKTDGDKIDGLIMGSHRDWVDYITLGVNYDFVSTTNLKKMAANYGQIKYEVTPNPLEMHGDSVVVTVKGTVPEKYFEKKAAILIAPAVKYNGGEYKLNPVTLKGEDVNGPGVAIPYKTGGTFKFQQTIPYVQGMSASDLDVNPTIYKPATGTVDPKATAEQIHAANKFIDVPTQKIADGVIITPSLIIHDEDLLTAADKLVKEKIDSKEALIYFKISKSDLDWKLPFNKKNKAALAELNDFINKGWQIKSVDVDGYASPDGEESFNQGLSAKRAVTGKGYVVDLFKKWAASKNATDFQKSLSGVMVNTASHGEDWDGFMQSVQASNMKEKSAILNIVNSQSDFDKRNHEIRNMSRVFKYLANDILPPLRRAVIKVNSYEPVKTDDQYLSTATNNPETLNVEELLYSATLTKDSKAQLAIYKAAMNQNKDDWRAFNNAAVIELNNGNVNQAGSYLNSANSLAPNNAIVLNNLGAVEARKGNINASLDLFKKAQGLGANETYNAGIPLISKAKYPEAVSALSAKKCNHNLGLAQMLSGNSQAAIVTLKCAPASADTYYLLAIAAARTNDNTMLWDNLSKAVKLNSSLKAKAANDREFIRYFNVPEFQAIVK
ncbi:MAG: outer membrane beta-barrel protein [Bacteroidota bacterium]|nr:outer membrane beta-barrel protein [Bacteroidota bacterium]